MNCSNHKQMCQASCLKNCEFHRQNQALKQQQQQKQKTKN